VSEGVGKVLMQADIEKKLCPRFRRWRDVCGDKRAVYTDLTGSIVDLGSHSQTLSAHILNAGRAGARKHDGAQMDTADLASDTDGDAEADEELRELPPSTPTPSGSSLALPGASQGNQSSSSLASSSSRLSSRSLLPDINALGIETEKRFAASDEWRKKKLSLLERQLAISEERSRRQIEREELDVDLKKRALWSQTYAQLVAVLGDERASEKARQISGWDERAVMPPST
jgi:hypothetical protein